VAFFVRPTNQEEVDPPMSITTNTVHGIDLHAPGGIELLMAHHRATFGDAVMEAPPEGTEGTPAGTEGTPPAGAAALNADGTPVVPAEGAQPAAEKIEDLPEWAQKIIRETRTEAGDNRVQAKSAEQQKQDAFDMIAKALGITKEGEAKQVDPAELTQTIAARDLEIKTLRIDNALGTALATAKALPAVADLLRGQGKLTDLDPAATDFATKLDGLVADALKAYPQLKAVQGAAASGGDFIGSSATPKAKPTTILGAVNQRYGL
jgi:hypothetical protein